MSGTAKPFALETQSKSQVKVRHPAPRFLARNWQFTRRMGPHHRSHPRRFWSPNRSSVRKCRAHLERCRRKGVGTSVLRQNLLSCCWRRNDWTSREVLEEVLSESPACSNRCGNCESGVWDEDWDRGCGTCAKMRDWLVRNWGFWKTTEGKGNIKVEDGIRLSACLTWTSFRVILNWKLLSDSVKTSEMSSVVATDGAS